MEKRQLGRTGFEVSILGVGGHTYPVGEGKNDFCNHDERAQLIRHLVDAGVNYFDTTWTNEAELLADSLRRADIREPVYVSLQYVDGISDPNWRKRLRGELETRLKIMGYDRAPLFIMGVGNNRPPFSEIMAACEALHALKAESMIQNIGVSCHELTAFDSIATIIEQADLIDYMMIRYNWKYQRANERLFPVAHEHNVGIVNMKVFCWDCGPDNWGRRISMFEPTEAEQTSNHSGSLNAAQRSLLWCLQTAACATTVPAINAMWEADQLIQAVETAEPSVVTDDFDRYLNRLYDHAELKNLATHARSLPIRERAAALMS
ncbi:MAG: aldo/keto reductase [Abitibacteriaceae bacterium]|nr:aldo/keto reductase [Abditibacteriaceae bacterium]